MLLLTFSSSIARDARILKPVPEHAALIATITARHLFCHRLFLLASSNADGMHAVETFAAVVPMTFDDVP
jgi:hypothetical protein